MTSLPRYGAIDSSLALLSEGYRFIGNRCVALGTDAFEARLLGQRTVCLRGAEGAEVLYDTAHMTRDGAMPATVKTVLVGRGGVQGLDGPAHRARKAMHMALTSGPTMRDEIAALTADALRHEAETWTGTQGAPLLTMFQRALCRAVCAWAGVPLPPEAVAERTRDMNAMITGAAAVGLGHLQGYRARWRSERWIGGLVEQARDGALEGSVDRPLGRIASHREPDGNRLETRVAAVELLNLLRPTVALG